MSYAFIIMQIGNPEIDKIYYDVFVPVLKACGLEAKRVDKHNSGGLLKSEIIEFINGADIILADVTNERPNCYLEIGYAMGVDKFKNLILTVKEDHFPDSPNYDKNGPKVHFDLGGYDILAWDAKKIPDIKEKLKKRIQRRLKIIDIQKPSSVSSLDNEWYKSQVENATEGLNKSGLSGYSEIKFTLLAPYHSWTHQQLIEAANFSQIHTFGWPIGTCINEVPEYKPKPRADGIFAEINAVENHGSYDYWALNKNGSYYILLTLFENLRSKNNIFLDTRIIRATEAMLYCARLYSKLEVDPSELVKFSIKYSGIKGRSLTSANNWRLSLRERRTEEDEIQSEINISLQEIESQLVENVIELVSPLFTMFDFFDIKREKYEVLVNNYVKGKI